MGEEKMCCTCKYNEGRFMCSPCRECCGTKFEYWEPKVNTLTVEKGTWAWAVAVMVSGAKVRQIRWVKGSYYAFRFSDEGKISLVLHTTTNKVPVAPATAHNPNGWLLYEEPKEPPTFADEYRGSIPGGSISAIRSLCNCTENRQAQAYAFCCESNTKKWCDISHREAIHMLSGKTDFADIGKRIRWKLEEEAGGEWL